MYSSPHCLFRLTLLVVLVLMLGWPDNGHHPRSAAAQRLPNVIIVYADDLGSADIGSFSTHRGAARPSTPNLDRMAADGVRLTSFYAAQAVCSASRSSPARIRTGWGYRGR